MTFAEALKKVIGILAGGRAPESVITAEAEQILSSASSRVTATALPRAELYLRAGEDAPLELTIIAERMARERAGGRPLQYVTGKQAFLDHEYEVTPAVLVPRPETEVLVTEAYRVLSGAPEVKTGFELGVGSGIISIELLSKFPGLQMYATDVSGRALDVARANARSILRTEAGRLHLIQVGSQDHWGPFAKGEGLPKPDFMISNPPYLLPEEATEEVRKHEPHEALFPPVFGEEGRDPLYFYSAIAREAMFILKDGGHVFLEVPHERAARIREIFTEAGWNATLIKDLTGRDRVLIAQELPENWESNG